MRVRGWGAKPSIGFAGLSEVTQADVALSYRDILAFKRRHEALVKEFRSQKYDSLQAAIDGYNLLKRAFAAHIEEVRTYVENRMLAGIDYEKASIKARVDRGDKSGSKPLGTREKIAVLFDGYRDSLMARIHQADPSWFAQKGPSGEAPIGDAGLPTVNMTFDRTFSHYTPSSGDSEALADKLWAEMRSFVKLTSGGERDATTDVYAPEHFIFMGLTFVNDILWSQFDADRFTKEASPYLARLKRLMPEVFYGKVILRSEGTGGHSDAFVLGSGAQAKAAGWYKSGKDQVELVGTGPRAWMSFGPMVLVHELAHRFYYKFMSQAQRGQYEDFFLRKYQSVSSYSTENAAEDFAETAMHYVYANGNMKARDARERFEAIIGGRRLGEEEEGSAECG